jgi:hypothetical protein
LPQHIYLPILLKISLVIPMKTQIAIDPVTQLSPRNLFCRGEDSHGTEEVLVHLIRSSSGISLKRSLLDTVSQLRGVIAWVVGRTTFLLPLA